MPLTHRLLLPRIIAIFLCFFDVNQDHLAGAQDNLKRPPSKSNPSKKAAAEKETNELVTPSGMTLVRIPAGKFLMGGSPKDPPEWVNEHPQHQMRIPKAFLIGKYEVTYGQFARFVDATAYQTDGEKRGRNYGYNSETSKHESGAFTWRNPGFEQTPEHPVVYASWNDAMAYCEWLSSEDRMNYRLPTEAEWEYACRAGSSSVYHFGNDPEGLAQFGNTDDAARAALMPPATFAIKANDGYVFTAPVGSFAANPFGLCDMHGNAHEWTLDFYTENYRIPQAPITTSMGITGPSNRVYRGGSWNYSPQGPRSAARSAIAAKGCASDIGFRVVVEK